MRMASQNHRYPSRPGRLRLAGGCCRGCSPFGRFCADDIASCDLPVR
ncbi:MAG: hypothetical protein AB1591_08800 [Pseudomonadota bacterium]